MTEQPAQPALAVTTQRQRSAAGRRAAAAHGQRRAGRPRPAASARWWR